MFIKLTKFLSENDTSESEYEYVNVNSIQVIRNFNYPPNKKRSEIFISDNLYIRGYNETAEEIIEKINQGS